ncbi:Sugar:cation symporter family protein [Thermosipho africanus Ob7]|uniref:MFS transporter n=1 Tax=Thermosipho africanus TaxID=2421 RepID=UPI000E0A483F|nr:glycoside-pentoside-hexuronide (GPH):cation symporter [Thermosipho africanus]RDI90873.1 Sugar:cation symporter family protein [Thermosipho africanus Ob7]
MKVKTKNIILYGMGDIFGGGSFIVIGTLFLLFLTDVVGLKPSYAGLVLVIGKIWDAISDPLMGYISDNTKSKFGRRRVYFLVGIFPIFLSFFLLWYPFSGSSQLSLFLYYSFAYILFSTVYTLVMVPYTALNAEMTEDFKIRTKLTGSRIMFSQISALISGVLPKLIIDSAKTKSEGFLKMGITFGILYAIPWIFVFLGTFEKVKVSSKKESSGNLFTIFKNKMFRLHMLMYIFAYTAMDILMALFIYYLTYYLGKENLFSICMGSILIFQIISLPLYVKISNKFGKARAYQIGLSIWVLGMTLLFLLPKSTSNVVLIINSAIVGMGLSAGVMIPWAMIPTIVDIDELITTKKRAGLYSGMMTLIRKIVQAVTLFLLGVFLDLIGYVPNTTQSETTLLWLRLSFFLFPVILLILGIIVSLKYKITPEIHKLLMNKLNDFRNGKTEVDENTKEIIEKVTGYKYESLYKAD